MFKCYFFLLVYKETIYRLNIVLVFCALLERCKPLSDIFGTLNGRLKDSAWISVKNTKQKDHLHIINYDSLNGFKNRTYARQINITMLMNY